MLLDIVMVVVGLIGLVAGGNWLVSGASRLAASFGVSSLIIGLTVVAMGTSSPELLVNISAALRGASDIAVGNVVGSNVANVGLILGVAGLLYPIAVRSTLVRREIPLMIGASVLTFLLAVDGEIGRVDGVILMLAFIGFNFLMYRLTVKDMADHAEDYPAQAEGQGMNRLTQLGYIVLGIVVLGVGAQLMVGGASNLARDLGVSELVIGITLVAVGTSLPEMAASVVAAFRRENDITVGNVVGSNIANLLFVLALTAIIRPIPVAAELMQVEFPVMIGFAVLVLPFAWNGILSRRESLLLLVAYAAFIVVAFVV